MSTESKTFMKELHIIISDSIDYTENVLYGTGVSSNDFLGGNLSAEDITILRTISLSRKQRYSMHKLLLALGRISVVGVLGVIDGVIVSEKFDLPDLSLVNRDSKKDIAEDLPLNEEFYLYADEV